MNKVANVIKKVGNQWQHDCLRNELRLHGNGTYSSNPGHWTFFEPYGLQSCL